MSAQQNRPYCALGLVFCKAEGEDADADAFYVFEGIGTGDEGGTSGTDIVDEQYVAPFQPAVIHKMEGVGNILLTLPARQLCLTLVKLLAAECLGDEGKMSDVANASGQHLTLVVATLTQSLTGQGNGQQHIDVAEEVGLL